MIDSFAIALAEDRRLNLLKLLIEAGGDANEAVLEIGLAALGHHAGLTRDAIRQDLHFLAERDLVRLDWYADKIAIAHITRRGVDVAQGRITMAGIKRPDIGD